MRLPWVVRSCSSGARVEGARRSSLLGKGAYIFRAKPKAKPAGVIFSASILIVGSAIVFAVSDA